MRRHRTNGSLTVARDRLAHEKVVELVGNRLARAKQIAILLARALLNGR